MPDGSSMVSCEVLLPPLKYGPGIFRGGGGGGALASLGLIAHVPISSLFPPLKHNPRYTTALHWAHGKYSV